jgi:hypothetical protein
MLMLSQSLELTVGEPASRRGVVAAVHQIMLPILKFNCQQRAVTCISFWWWGNLLIAARN